MMKWALILGLAVGMTVVFDSPAEAGLFRRGPMRRFLFGGPIRRRMIMRRMVRRGFCGNCMARRRIPRCGPGVHGGRCGFNNRNFRNFQNQRNFQFFNDPFRSQFDPGLNPALNPFFNPNASQFFPFRNSQPFNPNGGFSPVSAQQRESELERLFLQSQEPEATILNKSKWAGFCEDRQGVRSPFNMSQTPLRPVFEQGAMAIRNGRESLLIREAGDEKLVVRRDTELGRSYCLVEKQKS